MRGCFAVMAVALGMASMAAEPPQAPAMNETVNAVAFKLFQELRRGPGNLLFSPASVAVALDMALAGARGGCAAELREALGQKLPGDAAAAAKTFLDGLSRKEGANACDLHIANALWCDKDSPLLASYVELLRDGYAAPATAMDFRGSPGEAIKRINDWVTTATRGKINEIVGPLSVNASTRLVLTDAIYFKGVWQKVFLPEATRKEPFKLAGSGSCHAPLMRQTDKFLYSETPSAQVVELNYRGAKGVSMLVVLPREGVALDKLERELDLQWYKDVVSKLSVVNAELSLPKFKVRTQYELKDALGGLGVRKAFLPAEADFSGMTGKRDIFLGSVAHKAYARVDEGGTEAAAATAVAFEAVAPPPRKLRDVVFKADHPFLYIIRQRFPDTVLFIGRLAQPEPTNAEPPQK